MLLKQLAKSRSHIANMIRLLSLPDLAKRFFIKKISLTIGQIRPLIGNQTDCDEFIRNIIIKK